MSNRYFLLMLVCCISLSVVAGEVDTVAIFSGSMKKEIKNVVITPDAYKKKSNQRFPVVYLLHGYSGNYAQWIRTAPQLKQRADELQIIIVCPDGGFNSWYFDSPLDSSSQYETYVSKELVDYIDFRFRTIADRRHRAITGLSMGGHGGLFLAVRHAKVFGNGGSTSGGVDLRPFPGNWDIRKKIGDTTCCREAWEKNSVINLIDTLQNRTLNLMIDCGVDDFFMEVNRRLHAKLLSLKIDHDYIERPGGHTGAYWRNSIDYQLQFFKMKFED